MNLQNGYTVLNEKITDGERTFIAKGPEVEDKEIGPFAIGEFKLVYEKDGQIYGSTTGIPTENDTCFEAFDAIFIAGTGTGEGEVPGVETPADPEDPADPEAPEDKPTETTLMTTTVAETVYNADTEGTDIMTHTIPATDEWISFFEGLEKDAKYNIRFDDEEEGIIATYFGRNNMDESGTLVDFLFDFDSLTGIAYYPDLDLVGFQKNEDADLTGGFKVQVSAIPTVD